jgi:hypothetical protein
LSERICTAGTGWVVVVVGAPVVEVTGTVVAAEVEGVVDVAEEVVVVAGPACRLLEHPASITTATATVIGIPATRDGRTPRS